MGEIRIVDPGKKNTRISLSGMQEKSALSSHLKNGEQQMVTFSLSPWIGKPFLNTVYSFRKEFKERILFFKELTLIEKRVVFNDILHMSLMTYCICHFSWHSRFQSASGLHYH